ncbi:MAG: quinoprotein dehydrogenase-associated SoxYZ-like carrier [Pseudolabrys sp.]
MIGKSVRTVCLAGLAVIGFGTLVAMAAPAQNDDPWPQLKRQVFKNQPLADGSGLIALDMPYRAEDAAVVPLTVRATLPAGDKRHVKRLTIVIDHNPSPVAASFTFGAKADISAISTRVRVNSYTNVHAVAELSDGKLYVVKRFVKAAGGCSAPAIKDASAAKIGIGAMRFRQLVPAAASPGRTRQAQIMIRHPNNSGLQMNQITHLYIPPFFVKDLKVWQGKELVLAMDGGISISENPSIRFTYRSNGGKAFRAQAVDTKDHVYKGEWPAARSGT